MWFKTSRVALLLPVFVTVAKSSPNYSTYTAFGNIGSTANTDVGHWEKTDPTNGSEIFPHDSKGYHASPDLFIQANRGCWVYFYCAGDQPKKGDIASSDADKWKSITLNYTDNPDGSRLPSVCLLPADYVQSNWADLESTLTGLSTGWENYFASSVDGGGNKVQSEIGKAGDWGDSKVNSWENSVIQQAVNDALKKKRDVPITSAGPEAEPTAVTKFMESAPTPTMTTMATLKKRRDDVSTSMQPEPEPTDIAVLEQRSIESAVKSIWLVTVECYDGTRSPPTKIQGGY